MALSRPQWLADLSRSFKRHRQGRPGWTIETMRDRLRVVRDELPPRPDEPADAPQKRRSVTLATPPGPATATAALMEACALFDQVRAGAWQWPDPDGVPSASDEARLTPAGLIRATARLQAAIVPERASAETWDTCYQPYIDRLAARASIGKWSNEIELLTETLREWKPNSRSRQMAHDQFRQLWRQAGWLWPESLKSMRGNGRAAAPPEGVRSFTDQEIGELRQRIIRSTIQPASLVAWDCMALFGIRPKELQGLELIEQDGALVARVTRSKKSSGGSSGARLVPAVPPAGWPGDCHQLMERWKAHGLPEPLLTARSPGQVLWHQLDGLQRRPQISCEIPAELTPYGLRHAFALRLGTELGLSVREAAELMGHTPQVHLSIYGRRLDTPRLLSKVQGLVANR